MVFRFVKQLKIVYVQKSNIFKGNLIHSKEYVDIRVLNIYLYFPVHFAIAKIWEQLYLFINGGVKKENIG